MADRAHPMGAATALLALICSTQDQGHDQVDTDQLPWRAIENATLADAHRRMGGNWTDISKLLPGRSAFALESRWQGLRERFSNAAAAAAAQQQEVGSAHDTGAGVGSSGDAKAGAGAADGAADAGAAAAASSEHSEQRNDFEDDDDAIELGGAVQADQLYPQPAVASRNNMPWTRGGGNGNPWPQCRWQELGGHHKAVAGQDQHCDPAALAQLSKATSRRKHRCRKDVQ
jgi:hypothetical protein